MDIRFPYGDRTVYGIEVLQEGADADDPSSWRLATTHETYEQATGDFRYRFPNRIVEVSVSVTRSGAEPIMRRDAAEQYEVAGLHPTHPQTLHPDGSPKTLSRDEADMAAQFRSDQRDSLSPGLLPGGGPI